MDTQTFIAREGITMTAVKVPANPNMDGDAEWSAQASHYYVTFSRAGSPEKLVSYFSQGSAHKRAPQAEDVLDCLASDAASVENARGFEDWADELGYDTDSRKAERTYDVCRQQANHLRRFLGAQLYTTMLFGVERM